MPASEHLFLGRLRVDDEITGRRVTIELHPHDQAVELADGDRFVTVRLAIDPFTDPPGIADDL